MALKITYAAPANSTCPTGDAAKDFIQSFNNLCDLAVEVRPFGEVFTFRATKFAAEGVARGGFNVFQMYGDNYMARDHKLGGFRRA